MDLLRGDVEELKRSNKKLAEHTKAVAQKAVEDAKKQADKFRAEKERLLNEEVLDKDDIEKLRTLDKQIEESSVVETDDTEAVNEEIVTRYEEAKPVFMDENKEWYRKDYAMTTLADQTGTKFAEEHLKEHGVLPEPEVTFKHVLEVVKAQYPDMGKPKRGTKVTTRQNRTVANKPSTKRTLADLPEDQQPIAKMVMEASGLSEEEYLKNYEF
jgi:hypothetical protein